MTAQQIIITEHYDQKIVMLEQAGRVIQCWPEMRPHIGEIHIARYAQIWPAYRRAIAVLENDLQVSVRLGAGKMPQTGDRAVITITAQPFDTKKSQAVIGAELAGRFVILRQSASQTVHLRPSKKQRDGTAQMAEADAGQIEARLKQIAEQLLPVFGGVEIILRRSAGRLADLSPLVDEARYLVTQFCSAIQTGAEFQPEATRILAEKTLFGGFDAAGLAQIYAPDTPVSDVPAAEADTLFTQLDNAAGTQSESPSGAIFWAETTRAGMMIDCDGAQSGLAGQKLASMLVPEIMAFLRLRNPAGRIVIDFPYMGRQDQQTITEAIHHHGAEDSQIADIFGFTRSGLFELVRRHGTPPLEQWWQTG